MVLKAMERIFDIELDIEQHKWQIFCVCALAIVFQNCDRYDDILM